MPETKKPKDNKVKSLIEVTQSPIEEDKLLEGDINIVPITLPIVSESQIVKGVGGRYLEQDSSGSTFSTSETSWQDVTGLSITKSVNNRRVLLLFSSCIQVDTANSYTDITFEVDGVAQGGSDGLVKFWCPVADREYPISMCFVTSRLTGSHTFKVQLKSTGGDTTKLGATNSRMTFIAIELS